MTYAEHVQKRAAYIALLESPRQGVAAWANHYNLSYDTAKKIIEWGKENVFPIEWFSVENYTAASELPAESQLALLQRLFRDAVVQQTNEWGAERLYDHHYGYYAKDFLEETEPNRLLDTSYRY